LKILSLNGLLGYGYELKSLEKAMTMDIDYIGVDAGSTDPGPYYLGSGKSFTSRNAVKRDIELALPFALQHKIPFIIGTAGGAGGNIHVAWVQEIIEEIAAEKHLTLKMAVIETEVTQEYVREKLRSGKVFEMSPGLTLTQENINRCNRIVSQVGVDPFLTALESGVDVVLCGRACDTAIYAAPAIKWGLAEGLAIHMAKIMECGSLCTEPMTASDLMCATIELDSFTLEPPNPDRRCTIGRVAAHTMYEQCNPYYIYEPDGMADLRESKYEQVTDRAVRVTDSKFVTAERKTLKLEGSMLAGYRTITIAGINDPKTIQNIDSLIGTAKEFVAANMKDKVSAEDYTITLHKYGAPLPGAPALEMPNCSLGIIIDVVAKTQDIASTICALTRARLLHTDYPGRKSSAGNLAFPYSPSDIIFGPVYTFGIYHLVEVEDLCETAKISYVKVGE